MPASAERGNIDRHRRDVAVMLDDASQAAKQFGHDLHVEDVRNVADRRGARRQQGRRHELQDGVLGAGHTYLAREASPSCDPKHLHGGIVRGCVHRAGDARVA